MHQRLGLDDDWNDPEFPISLPATLPPNEGRELNSDDLRDIKIGVKRLVAAGCEKRVLYWCIGQLGDAAERLRQGKDRPPMGTREDMEGIVNAARSLSKAVRNHRDELLLVANASQDAIELPSGFLIDSLELPEEAMLVLFSSLMWLRKLASAWQSPNATALMKSKGGLFLLVYVWWHTTAHTRGGSAPYRLATEHAREVTDIIDAYQGVSYHIRDLSDKLHDFATKEPVLFRRIVALLTRLDEAAKPPVSLPPKNPDSLRIRRYSRHIL